MKPHPVPFPPPQQGMWLTYFINNIQQTLQFSLSVDPKQLLVQLLFLLLHFFGSAGVRCEGAAAA